MQFGFAGSPTFAAEILQCILEAGRIPELVITQAAKPTGRGQKLRHTPVYSLAQREGIPITSPSSLEEYANRITDIELLVVAAYGQILSRTVLELPKYGCVNVHASLLPRWRGASPIEHAILYGDEFSGISIMHIEPKLDAGPIYLQRRLQLNGSETSSSLSKNLSQLGGHALLEVLNKFLEGNIPKPIPQTTSGVTYAPRLTTADARLIWGDTATANERRVRAFVGRNSAFTTRGDLRLRIREATVQRGDFVPGRLYRTAKTLVIGCQRDGLALQTVQLNRGKGTPLSVPAALNGFGRFFEDGIQFD